YHYFNETDSNKIKLMKSLHATKKQIYFKLILPSNISNLISTLKINISMTLIGIIMGEFLTSKAGIGYLIMYGSQVFNLNIVITGTIILAIIATLLYYIIYTIEKKVKS
ncbi:MAG: ABC transporter permease subunit, partial [Bacilli bacterium]|nr:ABC transporter permease subunit [Bacilli bacterium]